MNTRQQLFGAVAAGMLLTSPSAEAQTPVSAICEMAKVIDGKMYMTCDFAEAIDGEEICNDTNNLSSDPLTRKNQLSIALAKALAHRALVHQDCQMQYGRQLPNPARILGNDWDDDNECTLVTLRDQCRAELGLE